MKKYLKVLTFLLFFLASTNDLLAKSAKLNIPEIADIADFEIVSASKEKEPIFETASSVYVLNSNDIRRSGATSIPEALRLIPGIEVYRSGSSKWSVTSRGFGKLYDNKILVMIDGREVHSSVFSGANWDITDLIIDDIDRIEVVRGGSTTTWGANSLNGVINVITKKSQYTQGNLFSALYGNKERSLEYRYGGNKNDLFYRVYGKKIYRDSLRNSDDNRGIKGSSANDDWQMNKAGFRADWKKSLRDEITLQGDIHQGEENQDLYIPTIEKTPIKDSEKVRGVNIDLRWKHDFNKNSLINLHSYVDNTNRKSKIYEINRNIISFDGEYHLKSSKKNKIKIGIGFRSTNDQIENGIVNNIVLTKFSPNNIRSNLYNAFVQDNYSIIPDKLDFTIGSKFEHHYLTGSHFLPSSQLRWMPNKQNILWTSYSKGIRQPTRLDTNLRILTANNGPIKIYWQGNEDFKAEQIKSYEIGYRNRSFKKLELDLSLFYNEYDNVRSFEPELSKFQYKLYNKSSAKTYGLNSSLNVNVLNNWKLLFGYSYVDVNLKYKPDSKDNLSIYDEGSSPKHQFQFQSRYNLTNKVDFDITIFKYSDLSNISLRNNSSFSIKGYTRTDLRIAYRPLENIEISLVGQKLFSGSNKETTRPLYGTQNATYGNQIYGNIKWKF